MRIRQLKIQNYNRIGEATIDFDRCASLTMIAGRLHSAGASSNGAGKSSIINAICWCVFGKEIPRSGDRRTAISMIRRDEASVRVFVEIVHEGKPFITIERCRKRSGSVELTIDGKRAATVQGGQEEIENRLGITFDLFTRTVVFGGELSAFCRMSPSDRTRLLEELLGIQHYLDASEAARMKVRESQDRYDDLVAAHAARTQELERAQEEFRDAVFELADERIKHSQSLVQRRFAVADLFEEFEEAYSELGELRRSLRNVEDTYETDMAEWNQRLKSLEREVSAINERWLTASRQVDSVSAELKTVEKQIALIESKRRPEVCPTCRRPWPSESTAPDTTKLRKEAQELRGIRDKRQRVVDTIETEKSSKQREISEHRDHMPKPAKADPKIEEARQAVIEIGGSLEAAFKLVEELEDSNWDALERNTRRTRQRLIDLRAAGDDDRDERRELGIKLAVYRYWQQGMGKDGIPAVLLESTAPSLNKAVEPFARALTRGAYSIRFAAVQTNSGRSDFRVEASNVEGGESYADLSKGELLRVDLCVLFAIRELMRERAAVRFDQLFCDEVFDGLDSEGIESFVRLLRSKKLAEQVFFISHDVMLQEAADDVILVDKINGVSTVRRIGEND